MIPRIAFAWIGLLGSALACAAPAAQADEATRWEVMAGRSRTLNSLWTNAAFVERLGDPHRLGRFTWTPDLALGWIQGRSSRYEHRLDHAVGVLALGARLELWRGLFISEQVAVTTATTDALSSHGQFVSSAGWQATHWVVLLRHISNAELHEPNHGETMLLLGYAF